MAAAPQFLTLEDNRDEPGTLELGLRRAFLALIAGLLVVGLFNTFGQEEHESVVTSEAATLAVSAPKAVRGGIFFQGRFTVAAEQDIDHATLVLDRGWTEGMHINTIEPAPVGEASRDGKLALDLGHVSAGEKIVLYLQFQVNPTNNGRRSADVELYDGEEFLARVDRTVTVWP